MYKLVWIEHKRKAKDFFFCDICGKQIKYAPEQRKYEDYNENFIPYISNFRITKENKIVFNNYVGDFHFHPKCFEEVKKGFFKRKKNRYGRESFNKKE